MRTRQATPLNTTTSKGKEIRDSTSAPERPNASVCTSTSGGLNSGYTSTGILRSSLTPNAINTATTIIMRKRSFKLDSTIQRIIMTDLLVCSELTTEKSQTLSRQTTSFVRDRHLLGLAKA